MKVVHVNTSDINGGAAIAAHRLHKAFLKKNINSKMIVMQKKTDEKEVVVAKNTKLEKHLFSNIRKLINKSFLLKYKNRKNSIFSSAKIGIDITNNKIIKEADIIHLHWIVGSYLSLNTLRKLLLLNKRIIWTLHDSWAFTGGCHVRYGCNKYIDNCGNCPILKSKTEKDLSYNIFKKKENIYSEVKDVKIVTPSNWLNKCVRESNLLNNFKNYVIPNTLDENIFKNINKNQARKILNLNLNKKYICFGAINSTNTDYKGWEFLKKAIHNLEDYDCDYENKIEILVFGSSHSENIENLPFKVNFLGNFHDEVSLALVYNASDLFVAPSLEDNLPNTVLESLHCETPVVAFDIGGMSDMIVHKQNGFLAKFKDSRDLAKGIIWVMNNLNNVKIDKSKFNNDKIVNQILNIYSN